MPHSRVKPHLWKLTPDDGRIGRRRGIESLACRSTAANGDAPPDDLNDLAEGVLTAVRPFLLSSNIDVEIWQDPGGPIMATVYAGLRSVAEITLTPALGAAAS